MDKTSWIAGETKTKKKMNQETSLIQDMAGYCTEKKTRNGYCAYK